MAELTMQEELAEPDTPSAGKWKLYFKSGGLYIVDDAGNELGPLVSGVLTAPQINDTTADHQYIFAVSELTADRIVTLPLLTAGDTFVFAAFTQTLTNKRITKRVVAVTPAATPAINSDNGDIFTITTQNAAITSMTTNLTGTPTGGQKMEIQILDDGTARAVAWGTSFASGPSTLPTTTVTNKWLFVGLEWSASRSKWICLAAGSEQ